MTTTIASNATVPHTNLVSTTTSTAAAAQLLRDMIAAHQAARPVAAAVPAPAPTPPVQPVPVAPAPVVASPPPARPAPAPRPSITLYSTALFAPAAPSTDISLMRAFIDIVTGSPITNFSTAAARQLADVAPVLRDISAALRLHDVLAAPDSLPQSTLYFHVTGRNR